MSEFKGTKGDWKIKDKTHDFETDIHAGNTRICEVKHYPNDIGEWEKDPSKEEGKANAKLISCAPEMLEMLEKIYDKLECGALGYDIQQLIKKATEL